jgi:hypothetical protein
MKNIIQPGIGRSARRTEITKKRISAFKPRFEKGSSPKEVADTILEAVTSGRPKFRYIVGQDASKLMDIRKNTSDEEFGKIVMNSVLERSR